MVCHNNKAFLLLVKKKHPELGPPFKRWLRVRLSAPAIKKIGSSSTLNVAAPVPQHCNIHINHCFYFTFYKLCCCRGKIKWGLKFKPVL